IQVLAEEIVKIEPSCMLHPNIIGAYEYNKSKILAQKGVEITASINNEVTANYGRQAITTVEGTTFLENSNLHQEVFGPFSMVVQCENVTQLETIISNLEGQLTGTVLAENELENYSNIVSALQNRVGRIIFNGVPTGVEVCSAMVHGGPYPASTDSRFTAVGNASIKRWVRPFSYQSWPNELLPDELKNENPLKISRLVDGKKTTDII
ncbi:MAG: aldehyde dehydrogenase (NADP(+)), partial [Bacteroidetes bacterium]|nr:aldehyde dehydrogenase (NADP(+)) [Bacteroidota bacterium]